MSEVHRGSKSYRITRVDGVKAAAIHSVGGSLGLTSGARGDQYELKIAITEVILSSAVHDFARSRR